MEMEKESSSAVCWGPATDGGAPARTNLGALLQGIKALSRKLPQDSEDWTLLDAKITSQHAKKQGATDEVAQHHVHAHVQHAHARASNMHTHRLLTCLVQRTRM